MLAPEFPLPESTLLRGPVQYNGFDGLFLLHSAIAIGAAHDSAERYPPPRCHPQTRKVVFEIILAWTKNAPRGSRVMYVQGEGGSGKTAISQTVAEYCAHTGQLGASFFFAHNKGDLSDGRLLFPTIAYKLAKVVPDLRVPISKAIQSDTTILSDEPEVQVEKLIIEPYRTIPHPPIPTLVVIDGLDGCEGTEMQQRILTLIAQLVIVHRLPLCFFITSRPNPAIQALFDGPMFHKMATRIPLELFVSDADMRTYLRSEFLSIRERWHAAIPEAWPSTDAVELLVGKSRSAGYLYASTVIRYVDDPRGDPVQRLYDLVVAAAAPGALSTVDDLYLHILSSGDHDTGKLLRAMGPLTCTFATLPSTELERLLNTEQGQIYKSLNHVRALVDIPPPRMLTGGPCIAQATTTEFLIDPGRAAHLWVDVGTHHAELASGCIRYIGEILDGLDDINLATYQYVRRRWTEHLQRAVPTPILLEQLGDVRFVYSRTISEVQIVISWLQCHPDVPSEIMRLWQSWAGELLHLQQPL
ncbi:NACHT domain-containing protein [Mycena chlorophos]|uniref:NACHT domain-containing protein n=1 Tax=Mycena chlorophos TaxID=658473 RepID=A0A8H6TDS1_MYCCL|nr:NACHT domain-containing protein [Mycena chlorophos]